MKIKILLYKGEGFGMVRAEMKLRGVINTIVSRNLKKKVIHSNLIDWRIK